MKTFDSGPARGVVECVDYGDGPVVFTCEHASNRLPDGLAWGDDAWLSDTHWAWDPGAAQVTRALARRFRAKAALAGFSRLVIDPNRTLDSDTLFRTVADGRPVHLNAGLDDAERQDRISRYWEAFHGAADRAVAAGDAPLVLSVHSFTPVYEGQVREVEVGVLYDTEDALGAVLADALPGGFAVRHNEPWSGKGGLMYSPDRHARAHGRRALEIELRQDLLADPSMLPALIDAVEHGLHAVLSALRP